MLKTIVLTTAVSLAIGLNANAACNLDGCEKIEKPAFSDEDIELIALVCIAEAEGESELGKRLVIDTILNRIDDESFPDDAYGVIYQPSQFSSMWNGRANRVHITDEVRDLVREEIEIRTNSEVIYFNAVGYSYGTPYDKIGGHYFSKR